MCGISGIVSIDRREISLGRLKKMTDAISHRGPDGEGHWVSEDGKIGLGHRRLSILDLSDSANQPMHYLDRYSIVFNGEIYNYIEIRNFLLQKGFTFSTTSDTEVLIALYHYKNEACLKELDGMFAFAIYDKIEQTIFCARDRFGEKPFYFVKTKETFLFASEMKSLWAAGIAKDCNKSMLYQYLSKGSIESLSNKKETFFQNIFRLPAACYLKIGVNDLSISENEYWDIDINEINESISLKSASDKFKELFFTSVTRRLRSDVDVGSSLSGGLDSSLIVSVMDHLELEKKISPKTFSAQFPGYLKDEAIYQEMVIRNTKVDPYFVKPTEDSMLKNLDSIIYHQEEPFGSASIAVQYEVFELAKQQRVTVLLDGQGADEILGGYHGYFHAFFNELERLDKQSYNSQWDAYQVIHQFNQINVSERPNRDWKNYIKKNVPNPLKKHLKSFYKDFFGQNNPEGLSKDFITAFEQESTAHLPLHNSLQEVLYSSTRVHGLEQLLRYADRNSMAHSREVRLPFLYHELVEFVFSLPSNFKINNGWTKFLMRYSFEYLLPKEICWRVDKIGYEPPQQSWMKDKRLLQKLNHSITQLTDNGFLDKNKVKKWNDSGNAELDHSIAWKFLMAENLLN